MGRAGSDRLGKLGIGNGDSLLGPSKLLSGVGGGSISRDCQVAAVLAHEIGHVIHRHGAQRMAKEQFKQRVAGA
ncbi:M48 family metalloprotease [Rubripirellula reticaptiva]|uniref:M48 family metalloprotease n=1 Tax=Rubripirellula reticaptiva TaxID=2528013 RepID=UPI0011B81767